MAENSKIAWTDSTFNPWLGCTKVSPGCANCYAENLMDTRYGKVEWGPNGTRVKTSESYWRKPLKWDREAKAAGVRARVFCASLADVFEDWQGTILDHRGDTVFEPTGNITRIRPATLDDIRAELFALIDETPNLDWLLLTKRPENIRRMWIPRFVPGERSDSIKCHKHRANVWLGTTIESQQYEHRWNEHLSKCRDLCGRTFVSYEPAMGPLDIMRWESVPDWIIYGGESAQSKPAQPCYIAWFRRGIKQCRERGVAPFVKQVGSNPWLSPRELEAMQSLPDYVPLKDRAGANPDEWPADIRIREIPEVSHA